MEPKQFMVEFESVGYNAVGATPQPRLADIERWAHLHELGFLRGADIGDVQGRLGNE
jgi:hypothetical protein